MARPRAGLPAAAPVSRLAAGFVSGLVAIALTLAGCGSDTTPRLTIEASWPASSNSAGTVDSLRFEVRDGGGELVGTPAWVAAGAGVTSARLTIDAEPGRGRIVRLLAIGHRTPASAGNDGLPGRGVLYFEQVADIETGSSDAATVTRVLRPFVPAFQAAHFEPDGQAHTVSWLRVPGATGYRLRRWVGEAAPLDTALADTIWSGASVPARYQAQALIDSTFGGAAGDGIDLVSPLPETPTGFRATPRSGERVDLRWSSPVLFNGAFEIERREVPLDFLGLVTLGSDTTSFRDSTTVDGRDWEYRVRARNAFGPGAWAPTIQARTPLNPPDGLTATPDSVATEIALAWTERSRSEDGYEVQRKDPGADLFNATAMLPVNASGWVDRTIVENSSYVYRVRARNAAGESGWSNEVTAITPLLPPSIPAGLTVDHVDTTWVDLRWGAARGIVSAYEVERRRPPGESFDTVTSTGPDVLVWRDTGLSAGATYQYRVRAVNSAGSIGYSNVMTVTTPGPAATHLKTRR